MDFERSDQPILKNIEADELIKAMQGFGAHLDDYAVLSQNDLTYLQAAVSDEGEFILEYQVGSIKEHYIADRTDISEEEVLRAFLSYLAGDNEWKDAYNWDSLDF